MSKAAGPKNPPRLVPRPGQSTQRVARLGIRRRPLKDLYHHFLRISWPSLFGTFMALYIAINAFFGCLYLVDDQAILNARPGSYRDAFFFSVQTLATIGYGGMAPQSLYGHLVVTVEALVGVLSFAIATGLIFAKFSRPNAGVMFSHHAVITQREGIPTLIFRAANERASNIVDAQVKLTLTRNEVTRDGEPMRRFHDLSLTRDYSPVFLLSWTIMHSIVAGSPLYGLDSDSLAACRSEIIVTFVGLDDLTLQQVHARHSYITEEIRFGHRLVDILINDAEGNRAVDYGRFHDVELERKAGPVPPHGA